MADPRRLTCLPFTAYQLREHFAPGTTTREASIMSMDAVPTRTSMEGAGFYNQHSSAQAAGIDRMMSLLEQAATDVPVGEEVLVLADPFWDSFEQTGDSDAFGTGWANGMRAISAPTLLGALSMDRGGLVDEVFQRCAVRIAAARP